MLKSILRTLCAALILSLCLPMAACDMDGIIDDLNDQINDYVGDVQIFETETETEKEETKTEPETESETDPQEIGTQQGDNKNASTDTDPAQTTAPPAPPVYNPVVNYNTDEIDVWRDDRRVMELFSPANMQWDGIAEIEDYKVDRIRYRGWIAFTSEQLGQVGYQIDDQEPVYDNAFFTETEQPIYDLAQQMGAGSASRFIINIPIEQISGTHIISILAHDKKGNSRLLYAFTLEKQPDPNAPVFSFGAADLAPSLLNANDVESAVLSQDSTYITIFTGLTGDPYYQLPMIEGRGLVANYVAIKYRTTAEITLGRALIGSGNYPTGMDDCVWYEMINDGKWHVLILDLTKVPAVQDGVINYLRWDMFAGGQYNVIDMGYIAAFLSEQAAMEYDASLAEYYPD